MFKKDELEAVIHKRESFSWKGLFQEMVTKEVNIRKPFVNIYITMQNLLIVNLMDNSRDFVFTVEKKIIVGMGIEIRSTNCSRNTSAQDVYMYALFRCS